MLTMKDIENKKFLKPSNTVKIQRILSVFGAPKIVDFRVKNKRVLNVNPIRL